MTNTFYNYLKLLKITFECIFTLKLRHFSDNNRYHKKILYLHLVFSKLHL